MLKEQKREFTRSLSVGVVCISTYFVSYYLRNILSVSTPEMLSVGFEKEFIGTLSSVYMLVYALGQLINGVLGDIIKAKYLALLGLLIAGVSTVSFPFVESAFLSIFIFALLGFSLSMLRGPLVKTICENMKNSYAHIACVFLSFVCSAGPLVASLFSILFDWRMTFVVAGLSGMGFALLSFCLLVLLEKKGIIRYKKQGREAGEKKSFFAVFKLDYFFFYMLIGMISEISATSIGFWLPTYITERLGFDENLSSIIFSVTAFVLAFAPFVSLFVLRLMKNRDVKVNFIFLSVSAVFFASALVFESPWVNVVLLLAARVLISMTAATLWSVYIPNQAESGLVSSLNGVLDFSGYLAATLANLLFSFSVGMIGWSGVVGIWIAIPAIGAICSFALLLKSKESKNV